jgi:KDO2-lipid IV(A) lauroyltransferase
LAFLVGNILNVIPTRDRRIARLQLEKILKHPCPKEVTRLMYRSLAYTFVEALSIKELLKSPLTIENLTPAVLESYRDFPQGKMIITGHFSNWELLAGFIKKFDSAPLSVIAKNAKNQTLDRILTAIRTDYGVRIINKDEKSGAFKILKGLKKGEAMGVLIDQDTDVKSEFIPFFGMPAKTPDALIDTAIQTKAGIFVAFVTRKSPFRFTVEMTQIEDLRTKEEILLRFNQMLEAKLRQNPEQWAWVHKRWRTQQNGETLRTNDYIRYLEKL